MACEPLEPRRLLVNPWLVGVRQFQDLKLELNSNGGRHWAYVIGCRKDAGPSLNVPTRFFDGDVSGTNRSYDVTGIGGSAFAGCKNLQSVKLPTGVDFVGPSAFTGCTSLASVALQIGVRTIDESAFQGCTSLKSITIPISVTAINQSAFRGCTGLSEVTFQSLIMPFALELSIGKEAFAGCSSLQSFTVPARARAVGSGAFADCSSLASIGVELQNPSYVGVAGNLFTKDKSQLLAYPAGKSGVATVPAGVKMIDPLAFRGCTKVTSVALPAGMKFIANGTFKGCTGLTSMQIPDGVTAIGADAFGGCTALTSVKLPESLGVIHHQAFKDCTGLKNVTIPGGVQTIGERAFVGCTGLTSIIVSAGVKEIDDEAFAGCTGLTSVAIPASVGMIAVDSGFENDRDAFFGCANLASIQVSPANPTYASHDGILYTKDRQTLLLSPDGKAGTCVIPPGVKSIGDYAFQWCAKLTGVRIPASVTSIGVAAFARAGLTSVTIPSGVSVIHPGAFLLCPLKTAAIAGSGVKLGNKVFQSTSLQTVSFGSAPPVGTSFIWFSPQVVIRYPLGHPLWQPYVGKAFAGFPTQAVAPAAAIPEAPAVASQIGKVTISWKPLAVREGVEPVSDYVVQYRPVGAARWVTVADGTSTQASAVVGGLLVGTSYEFRVAAVNFFGTGGFSSASAAIRVRAT